MAESKDVATVDTAVTPAMIEPTTALVDAAYDAILEGKLPPEIGDPSVTQRAIQERLRYADSYEATFSPQKLKAWREYLDKPVTVCAFHLNPSNFNEGQAVYAIVEIVHPDSGEVEAVSVGGGNVLVQLVKAWEMDWLPTQLKLTAKSLEGGRDVLWLEKA